MHVLGVDNNGNMMMKWSETAVCTPDRSRFGLNGIVFLVRRTIDRHLKIPPHRLGECKQNQILIHSKYLRMIGALLSKHQLRASFLRNHDKQFT